MCVSHTIKHLLAFPLLLIVRFYQLFISPFLGQNCRFHPTCSCYAHQALKEHGALTGSYLAIKRIIKCQPMHPGGIDLVPPAKQKNHTIHKSKINTN
ncbi:membrane protein insertion efficiency factor YidD [Glaciecola sp. 2405UD65-10]|jgi:putative membrane protein insertion efficiency factor|uniref:membrane protein insertion efficiency factor YidD n=1 Tax=Glaciecola sp. 2405UD65-10 TaxID=3397244 RepID=UPI003B5B0A20